MMKLIRISSCRTCPHCIDFRGNVTFKYCAKYVVEKKTLVYEAAIPDIIIDMGLYWEKCILEESSE